MALLDYITFYLFWVGVYHCPYKSAAYPGHGYFYNLYGYLLILILLIFEKNAQQWAADRFGCTAENQAKYREIEENVFRKPQTPKPAANIADQIIIEEQDEDEDSIMQPKKKGPFDQSMANSKSIISESFAFIDDEPFRSSPKNEEEIRNELRMWISKKYMFKILEGCKVLLEETI